ncbi:Transcriptional regulator [gamma proteobacterium HdN1]|nr:Transcriptional regulator [gamma proteobacterium HdN1]
MSHAATSTSHTRNATKARTRARIVNAAIETLIEEGYAGISMNKVTKRAGIAQPSFYVHFETMEQLFEAMANDLAERFIHPLQRSLETVLLTLHPEEIRDVIHRLFIAGFDIIRGQQALCRMVWAERDQPNSPLGAHLSRFYNDNKVGWAQVFMNIGIAGKTPTEQVRLRLFMDGVFALFECYASQFIAGHYEDVEAPAEALTDYVLFYWQDDLPRLISTHQATAAFSSDSPTD